MRYRITYEYDPRNEPCYFAKCQVEGHKEIVRAGYSWELAKGRLIAAILLHVNEAIRSIPEPEEIEL